MPDRSVLVTADLPVSSARVAAVLGGRDVWIRTGTALGFRVNAHPSATGAVADGDLLRLRRGDRPGGRSLILQARRSDPTALPAWTVLAGPGTVAGLTVELTELTPAAGDGEPRRTRVTVRWQVRRRPVLDRWSDRTVTAAGRLLLGLVDVTARAPRLVVAAAILRRAEEQTELLIARVPSGEWELPGGKVEPRESEHEALRREIVEELGVQVTPYRRVGRPVDLGDRLELRCLTATIDPGQPAAQAREHSELRWVTAQDLDDVVLRPADEVWRDDLRRLLAGRSDGHPTRPHPTASPEDTLGDSSSSQR